MNETLLVLPVGLAIAWFVLGLAELLAYMTQSVGEHAGKLDSSEGLGLFYNVDGQVIVTRGPIELGEYELG